MKKSIIPKQQDPMINFYQQQMREAIEKPWLASLMLQHAKRLVERFVTYYQQLKSLSRQARHRWQKKLSLSLAGMALLLALSNSSAHASTILVDGTDCTLDDAIRSANTDESVEDCAAGSGADTLVLQKNIALSGVTTEVSSTITIEGNGHTIDAIGNSHRIFQISAAGDLTVNKATLTGGDTSSADLKGGGRGGGILNEGGIVTLNNSTITGNKSDRGGGIYNDQGTVTLNNSAVTGNTSIEL
ncbi:MAG: hypothetical protein GY805_01370, partial [Chloroflexi bacterium]|nr:hypothetical protein [Chloroflexota bacterium]